MLGARPGASWIKVNPDKSWDRLGSNIWARTNHESLSYPTRGVVHVLESGENKGIEIKDCQETMCGQLVLLPCLYQLVRHQNPRETQTLGEGILDS